MSNYIQSNPIQSLITIVKLRHFTIQKHSSECHCFLGKVAVPLMKISFDNSIDFSFSLFFSFIKPQETNHGIYHRSIYRYQQVPDIKETFIGSGNPSQIIIPQGTIDYRATSFSSYSSASVSQRSL